MIVELPLIVLVVAVSFLVLAATVLGAAVYRSHRFKPSPHTGNDVNVPPLLQRTQFTAEAVQPGGRRHGFFKALQRLTKSQEQYIDVETQENKEYLGKINFSLGFDEESHTMSIHILEAVDLPAMDLTGSSDPYARVTLLPDRNDVKLTRIHRRSLCPKFAQILHFPGHSSKKLQEMTLCVQVMDHDRFTRDDPIGEILLPMKNVKFENVPVYWKHLQKPTINKEYKGELMLSLCYLPDTNKLTVVVIKAKDLPRKDVIGSSDPYVKLWLVQQGSKMDKRKTTTKSQTLSPVFNESFAFNLPPKEKLDDDIQLVIAVMDYDLLSSNDEMGHCVVGSKGGESGIKHWKEVLDHPDHPCAMWHKLTPKW